MMAEQKGREIAIVSEEEARKHLQETYADPEAAGKFFDRLRGDPDSSGVIHGCYNANGANAPNGTTLNIVNSDAFSWKNNQTAISWNQTGPQGGFLRRHRRRGEPNRTR